MKPVANEATKMEPTARTRRLTLQSLIADGSEIWVRNNSGKITGKDSGNIVLQVGQGNMIDKVVIPPGRDPVCLTDQVTPKLLAECMDLFKLVKSEALELLNPEQADEYYKQNTARKQIVEDKIKKLTTEPAPRPNVPKRTARDINFDHGPVDAKPVATDTYTIHPKLGDICLKAKHAAISEHEALERLLEQESVLTLDDYNYLSTNGVYNGVKRWARDQAAKIAAE